ncbi:hypothetical protein DEO72_LG11g622 [Vigna unguiculata]|uniref:Uncharacterized protein n=1 Tax=Vigna unguiculata TaxID=3917 RepID=A0A4D6NP61_VIGUN|nr:hypothetical protein DEO72_LG11g622 [Vigna unguiculata]
MVVIWEWWCQRFQIREPNIVYLRPKLEVVVHPYANSTTLRHTIAPPSTTTTIVLRRRLSLLRTTLLWRCGYTSTVQEGGFVPVSSCSWRRRMRLYTIQGLLPQWSDVVAPIKRWFKRNLDRSCVEDGGSAVIRVSNGGEVRCSGVRDEAMVVKFAATNGGEVRCSESLKI